MCPVKRSFEFGAILLLMIMFLGGSTATASPPDYHPKLPPNIKTIEGAIADLTALLKETKIFFNTGKDDVSKCRTISMASFSKYDVSKAGQWQQDGRCFYYANRIDVTSDRIDFPLFPLYYKELSGFDIIVTEGYLINLPKGRTMNFKIKDDNAAAQRMADDLFLIQQVMDKHNADKLAAFKERAAQYHAMKVKPTVSEEQRKFIVQANALAQQKDYAGAVDHYNKAIEVDPVSYPGAYFNMALIYAQERQFKSAIECMKTYLLLEPEAKDARSSQDKIYEWEAMVNKK